MWARLEQSGRDLEFEFWNELKKRIFSEMVIFGEFQVKNHTNSSLYQEIHSLHSRFYSEPKRNQVHAPQE